MQSASLVNILKYKKSNFHVYTIVSYFKMLSSASWEIMRIIPAKQMYIQGLLKFIDWGKQFFTDVITLQVPDWSSQQCSGWKGGFGIGDSFIFIFCPALCISVCPEERGAEPCGEHAHPPSQLLLLKSPLPFGLDEISSFALEMGWFRCLHRGKKSLK